MKLILTVLAATLAFTAARAQSPAADAPWVSLFNGTNFDGWRIIALTNPAPVVVEDGAMVLRQRRNTSEHTFVASRQKYSDFILELDLKDDPGFNSGILLRCADAPADAQVRLNGYQVKIDNTPRAWTGGIFDDYGGNWKWLFNLKDDARARAAFKLGEWARFRIECMGSTIKVWVNGVPTCHLLDEKYREGYLAFKIHSLGDNPNAGQSAIRLKNIRIITDEPKRFARTMDLLPRRAPPQPDEDDGGIQLPDGYRATVVADNRGTIAARAGRSAFWSCGPTAIFTRSRARAASLRSATPMATGARKSSGSSARAAGRASRCSRTGSIFPAPPPSGATSWTPKNLCPLVSRS